MLIKVQDLTKVWDINNHRAQKVHCKVGEMLAIDCQPVSMVEDMSLDRFKTLKPCCHCPSRRYFTEAIIPKIYTTII